MANTFDIANASDAQISIPLTFNREVRNLIDQKLYIEIEAQAVENVEVRAVLNVNAVDQKEIFLEGEENQVKRFEVPIIKLRQDNKLELYISA